MQTGDPLEIILQNPRQPITATLIPGDGIGPEITRSVQEVFSAADIGIEWEVFSMDHFASTGDAGTIPDEILTRIKKNRIGLKGPTETPIGVGHRSLNVNLRQALQLYANVRPIRNIPGLKSLHENIDLIIVRENTEDLYAGIEYNVSPTVAHAIKIVTYEASHRICIYAFELARRLNRRKVTAVHKANIMKRTDGLFLDAYRSAAKEFPEIELEEMIVDAFAMKLVMTPKIYDVIVTENLYGDILSDVAAGLTGGLGIAPGANIGAEVALFEAVHGSAPDIAGKNIANPTALLLSAIMMLEHIGGVIQAARLRVALHKTISDRETRTRDLGGMLSTAEFTRAVIKNLRAST